MTSRKRAISQTHEKFTSFSPYLTVGSIERIVAPKPSEHIYISVHIILCIILKKGVGAECLVLKKLIGNTKIFFYFDTSRKIKKTSDPFVMNKLKIVKNPLNTLNR